jgi:predicted ATPase
VRIGLLGGLTVEHDGLRVPVSGAMQLAVLFRLAVDAGSAVSYRAIAEDVWTDAPENERAALQSIVSRLRSQLPGGTIESTVGGYRLAVAREDVDALAFADLVALAVVAEGEERVRLASDALSLWSGEPWVPSEEFDWFERDLRRDRATALGLGGVAAAVQHRLSAIPVPLTGLVGRERELAAVSDQLATSRLTTIIGVGGAGKTRLAVETASSIPASVLVELAPVGSEEIFTAILAATGRELRTADGANPSGTRDRVLEALVGRPVLLVLDNCEHVIDDVAAAAEWLLGALPQLRILATSREPLTIAGEAFVAVGPLAHPGQTALESTDARELRGYDAIELFHQRAVAARGVVLDDTELVVAARICLRLDGLPLALELAAAKLRTMSPAEVLAGLEDRFALLTGGFRTALPRHRTLRAMVDWSWSLLSEDERRALSWIAVFPAGFDAADAGRVAGAMALSTASVFDSLVDRSLLQRTRGRFRALETIREYGIERLSEREELAAARLMQATVMADRAVESDCLLRGPRILDAISWFDSEEDNIAAALRYTTGVPLADLAVRLAVACAWYWTIRGREEDSSTWLMAVSSLAGEVDSDEGRTLAAVAPIFMAFGDSWEEDAEHRRSLTTEVRALVENLPIVGAGAHEILQLVRPLVEAISIAGIDRRAVMLNVRVPSGEDLGLDPWPTAILHVVGAALSQNRGEIDVLGEESRLSIELFTGIGDIWGLALSQQMHAEWLMLTGRLDEAFAVTEESTQNFRRITPSWDLANQQALAISILLRQGRFEEVSTRMALLLEEAETSSNLRTMFQARSTALTTAVAMGDVHAAVEHLAALDSTAGGWPRMPEQVTAVIELSRAGVHSLRGDRIAAENAIRLAVDAALTSHDYPVIGAVALGFGSLALERGDLPEALRALDLATAVIGIRDETSPQAIAIERAAAAAGVKRAGAEAPTRSVALESLAERGGVAGAAPETA